MSLACPSCFKDNKLWEDVELKGWQSEDGQREAEWGTAEPTGDIGCSCGWEGRKTQLIDLFQIDPPDPNQTSLL